MSGEVHEVFPGISLRVNEEKGSRSANGGVNPGGKLFEIDHCLEGRAEFALGNGFGYLAPGDILISDKVNFARDAFFPLGFYKGITITVDTSKAPRCLSCFLDDVNVSPEKLREKFCAKNGFIARSSDQIAHIFSELYNVPESIRGGYYKVKVLELFLFLSALETDPAETARHSVSRAHMSLARAVSRYLTDHMDERVTLDMLSSVFHISGTQIKSSFREVYGMSIYSHVRAQKMQAAAKLLCESDSTVIEIAGRFGYDNASKFAKAFRDVMGASPNEYRNFKNPSEWSRQKADNVV